MIENIQHLRAFAAISVVLFHVISRAEAYSVGPEILHALDFWTANGVDIFFVISGFVMLHTQLNRPKSAASFLRSRIVRIVPVYWILTTVFVLLFVVLPQTFREITPSFQWSLSSYLFTSQLAIERSPLIHVGWTLEWEMLFYIIFAIGIYLPGQRLGLGFVTATMILVAHASEQWLVVEFVLGMVVAWLYNIGQVDRGWGTVIFFVGVAGLALSLVEEFRILDRLIFWGIPATLIVFGAVCSNQLKGRWFLYLGAASYSIYLVQVFTIPAFYKVTAGVAEAVNNDLLALACLIFSVVAGCVTYTCLERPITTLLRRP